MDYLIGIDDAGRGPVIGPLILAGILIKKNEEIKLQEIGARDSKTLLPAKRKKLGDLIKKNYNFFTTISTSQEIDSQNLNDLEAIKTAMIINKLSKEVNGNITAIIDCPSTNILAWTATVKKFVENKNIEIKCEHKADANHPVVSAASIIAKEKREEEVERIKKEWNLDFGSGYPADPKTIDFIKHNFNNEKYSKEIRHSWESIKRLKNTTDQKKLF